MVQWVGLDHGFQSVFLFRTLVPKDDSWKKKSTPQSNKVRKLPINLPLGVDKALRSPVLRNLFNLFNQMLPRLICPEPLLQEHC